MLIKRLLMAYGRHHFEVCWRHFSVSGWPEVCRAHTCKQVRAKNYSRTKRHYLVKITSLMIYNQISLSQKETNKRKMIQNGSDINTQESAKVTSEHLSFLLHAFQFGFRCSRNGGPSVIWIISLYLWYQVYFVIITVEFLFNVLSITYLKKIWLWTVPLREWWMHRFG